jgi:hypothetical protein
MSRILSIRASSIGGLFDCAYKWEWEHLLGMRSVVGRRAVLGSAVHKGAAVFDQSRVDGGNLTADDAVGAVVDYLREPEGEWQEQEGDPTAKQAEEIGITLHTKYCNQISQQFEYKRVEYRFGELDVSLPNTDIVIRLTGTMDRQRIVTAHQGTPGLGIADIKTGYRAAHKDGTADIKGRGLQLAVYEILTENIENEPVTLPAKIIGLGTSKSATVGMSDFTRSPRKQLLGGAGEHSLLEMAANMLETGLFPPNPTSFLCNPKYCSRWNTCSYHE